MYLIVPLCVVIPYFRESFQWWSRCDPGRVGCQARRCMAEFVDSNRREARKAISGQVEGTAITLHPEYALIYLVHVLAHHPNYPIPSGDTPPDPAAYEPFYRWSLLWDLVIFIGYMLHCLPLLRSLGALVRPWSCSLEPASKQSDAVDLCPTLYILFGH